MKEESEKKQEKKQEEKVVRYQEFPKHKWGKPWSIMNHREKKIREM
jgi:hypothetical protein